MLTDREHQIRTLTILLVLMLGIFFAALPTGTALSAPSGQVEPQSLQLGEYAFINMTVDDVVAYELVLPLDGIYLFTTEDEDEALAFDMVIRDAAGEVRAEGVFEPLDLAWKRVHTRSNLRQSTTPSSPSLLSVRSAT